ncbi:glycerophosphodiester phosphodiesterase [Chloropicon primus]|uniref:glycerophosphodiester phosphodiesterase n=1 Tax=Chloropicon primus TaxID=1764295 RepID=A0A5B8MZL6_9CHLO|nr:glycerophosphodiester phosphodiesterase [Chloropicon primus]|eukprot:QDZ26117.1 glycerophosphodiester phosphodiesterase [Chloropicon primus]
MEQRRGGGDYVELEVIEDGTTRGSSTHATSGQEESTSQVLRRRRFHWPSPAFLLLAFVLAMASFLFGTALRTSDGGIKRTKVYRGSDGGSIALPETYVRPLVIGHRGSCGMLPEHTLEGYKLAMKQHADCIECDVILTKDGVPICRHDLTLEQTTDVASRPEFDHKRTTRDVEGETTTGWFAVDFTLDELKQLRALQRLDFRDPNYDGLFQVATLQEQIDLVKENSGDGGDVDVLSGHDDEAASWHLKLLNYFMKFWGYSSEDKDKGTDQGHHHHTPKTCLYPELKSTTWHNSLGMWGGKRSEDIILDVLEKNGYKTKDDNIYLQSFETLDLEYVHKKSSLKLIQLIGAPDVVQWDTKRPYEELMSEKGISEIAKYAFAVSPSKNDICEKNTTTGYIDASSVAKGRSWVEMIHSKGLQVHPWVLRDEDRYLAWNYGQDAYNEYTMFIRDVGVDGFFTDFPATASNYIRLFELDLAYQSSHKEKLP